MSFLTEASGQRITDSLSPRWVFDRIEDWARRSPNQFAFAVDHENRIEEYRYSDVVGEADRVAADLIAAGIERGDRIGILMENVPQWVFVLLGAMRVGAVTVPLATTLPESSLRLIAEHAGCRLVFTDDVNREKAEALGVPVNDHAGASRHPSFSRRGNSPPDTGGVARSAGVVIHEPSDTALIIYTSGTTGDPKGVELTFQNLVADIQPLLEALEISPDHRILSVLPFSHVLPLIANALGPLCAGAGVVFLSSISPQRIIDAFHRHRITFFVCVPQFFYVLHKRIFSQVASQPLPMRILFRSMLRISRRIPNPRLRRKLFAKIHHAIGPELWLMASGGSYFDPHVARDLNDLGYTVIQAYGLTETTAAATVTPVRDNRIGTVGKPLRGVSVKVDSPNEDGVGEIQIRGPIIMKGYYRDPRKTAAVLDDGWLHTGDLGRIDGDGNLTITGRSKDVIVLASGKNIYPEELETHYSQSPFIKEICILGVNDEKLHAVVVPDMDEFRRRGETSIMEMIRFQIENLTKQLPSYHHVHSLALRNEPFPRTVTRKLKRFEIQKEESQRRDAAPKPAGTDHPRFSEGAGAVVAELVREAKPEAGALDPSMNLELDLGFDSLNRVELFALLETRLGTRIDEQQAARIYTLGELIDVLEASSEMQSPRARSWREILDVPPSDPMHQHYIFKPRRILSPTAFVVMRFLKSLGRLCYSLRGYGLEKLPPNLPFIICPNHESFLDGPMLIALLPRRVIYNMFILGYSDYWENALSRRIAEMCNIVAIDPNVNLIRAMQIGAVGLKRKRVLLVFPEGTRSIDGHVDTFKKGAATLAYELGVPIVPVGIRGTFESWPRGGGFRFHPIEIHFGSPIDPHAFAQAADPYAALTEKLRNDVKALSGDV